MRKVTYKFSHSSTDYYLSGQFGWLKKITDPKSTVLITDENVYRAHQKIFQGWNLMVLKAGEENKIQETIDAVIDNLLAIEADRSTTLVGVGGGVITDIAGFVASVYMRGLRFGFVPTSLLAMVDASIGGKNGIDVGVYKNMVGVIRQPAFILHDTRLLKTLPTREWINGFAEVIKHACIRDAALFRELDSRTSEGYRKDQTALDKMIKRNMILKTKVVQRDEFEKGERRLLNFGHTIGHAMENQYELFHGQAVSIGMVSACHISEKLTRFRQTNEVVSLLEKYGLPAYASFNKQKVFNVLKMDKKRERKSIHFVLLERIGKAVIKQVSMPQLQKILREL